MRARTLAGIGRVLGEQRQAVFRRPRIQGAEALPKMLVHGERALLARRVRDAGDDGPLGVDEIDALQALDPGQLLEIVFERRAGLKHRGPDRILSLSPRAPAPPCPDVRHPGRYRAIARAAANAAQAASAVAHAPQATSATVTFIDQVRNVAWLVRS